MKAKYILGMLLVLLMATTACVYAAEATLDDYKFTIPDDYTLGEESGKILSMYNAENKSIVALSIGKASYLKSDALSNKINDLENKGYKVSNNRTFQYGGKDIIEIDYENNARQYNQYMWEGDGNECIIAIYCHHLDEDPVPFEDSPIKTIVDTMDKK